MKNNIVKLSQKIYLLKFLKKNNIKEKYFGNKNIYFDSICSINFFSENSLTFLEKKFTVKSNNNIKKKKPGIVITDGKNISGIGKNLIISKKPRELFIKILKILINDHLFKINYFNSNNKKFSKVNIMENVKIGKNCEIGANVYLANCEIGNNVKIGPNTTIGYGGMTLYKKNKKDIKFLNVGKIIIGDNVTIGANCSFMRGGISNTIISNDVLISNQVNIGHDVIVLESTIISSGVQLIGGVSVGKKCILASGSILNANILVGNSCFVGLGSVVIKNIEKNTKVFGNPAKKISNN